MYGYDILKFLIEVWTRIGQPCGKYLAPIMAPTVAQPEAFGELAKVADRLSSTVREQLVAMPGHDRPAAQTHQRSSLPRGEVRDPSRATLRSSIVAVGRWTRWSRPQGSSRSIWSLIADTVLGVSATGP